MPPATATTAPAALHLAGRSPLAHRLVAALRAGDAARVARLAGEEPCDRRDAALTLSLLHDLHLAPVDQLGAAVHFQHDPALAARRATLEAAFVARLERADRRQGWDLPPEPVAAVRAIAARDLVPPLYDWLATEADAHQLRLFLALEGGPDGGFDDLVALCQVGLDGAPKLELARNYWDELGRGRAHAVHTELHRRMVAAAELPDLPADRQPVAALERGLLAGLLAVNRARQPELVGALGLIELQAGPRCRRVLAALDRLHLDADARPFYEEHAVTDPRHGKDWLDEVITPLATSPAWADGIVRGARWRWLVNDAFLHAAAGRLGAPAEVADRPAGAARHPSVADWPGSAPA